jgi:glucan 1,3-beta-glucosidase
MQEERRQEIVRPWIRGVNIGGWLLMERFISPYMFAITSCHIQGDFCWYPGQLSAPPTNSPDHKYCDLYRCKPQMIDSAAGGKDFPTDEYTLAKSFPNKATAREYLNYHWENFVQKQDVIALKEAGVTHVRVPLPHWIMGDIKEGTFENPFRLSQMIYFFKSSQLILPFLYLIGEPWVDGQWLYFVRFASWCREIGIEVWPDIHTAPGSQNGFDNSGQLLAGGPTCKNWSGNEENVKRSLKAVDDITKAIVRDSIGDVVTGFGVLNEPFEDCDQEIVRTFYDDALQIVRKNMVHDTNVFIGDLFKSSKFNDGFWIDADDYSNTFLDSHYYHGKPWFGAFFRLHNTFVVS